jgi:hypothetical protein
VRLDGIFAALEPVVEVVPVVPAAPLVPDVPLVDVVPVVLVVPEVVEVPEVLEVPDAVDAGGGAGEVAGGFAPLSAGAEAMVFVSSPDGVGCGHNFTIA